MGAAVQGMLWGRAAFDWAELQEATAQPLWEAMLDAAAVGPATHLLDAGCGAGGASALAARRGARVNGLDASEALLAIARRRVPEGDFLLGDLEALPYADSTFTTIIAADVLPYVIRPVAALCELRRVCRSEGQVLIALWGRQEECEQHAIAAALCRVLPTPLGEEPFRLSATGTLDALVTQADLRLVGAGDVICRCDYPDLDTAWQALAAAGPMQAALRVLGQRRLKTIVLEALTPFVTDHGGVCLKNRFRYITAVPAPVGERRAPRRRLSG
jgi:SAM-dependent methyltransferase